VPDQPLQQRQFEKDWYKSRAIWGDIITITLTALHLAGYDSPVTANEATDIVFGASQDILSIVGIALSVYGRTHATGPIKWSR
jgi:hypothetical protein